MRKLYVVAIFLGLSSAAGYAAADTSAEKQKGKPGSSCKTSSDCDQSNQPQSCRDGKCRIEQVPPPTT